MASVRWIGRAQAVAQVDTVTIANTWAQNDTVTLTINNKALTVTIGTLVTTAEVAASIKQAWQGEALVDTSASYTPEDGGQDIAEHAEITATFSGSVVTLTHDTPGVPFTLTVTESTAGTGTATEATATAATGPNFWDNVDNWDTGAAPIAADDVFIDNSAVPILYALDASGATFTSMTIGANFTGTIGLPKQNAGGYVEYRGEYLQADVTTLTIGRGEGSGSGRLKINLGTVQSSVVVESTGTPIETGLPAVILLGTHVSNTLSVLAGSVGVAVFGGETSVLDIVRNTTGDVTLGAGVDLNNGGSGNKIVNNQAGTLEFYSVTVNVENSGGTMLIGGTASIGTLTIRGGTVDYQSSGTITTAVVGGFEGAILDFSNHNTPRTITTTTLSAGGQINDPFSTVIYTNAIALDADVRTVTAA